MEISKGKRLIDTGAFKILYGLCAALFVLRWVYARPGGAALLFAPAALSLLFLWIKGTHSARERFAALSCAFFCTLGFMLFTDTEKSLMWLFIFAMWALLAGAALKKDFTGPVRGCSFALGLLFALAVFLGRQLDVAGRLEILYVGRTEALELLTAFLGLALGFAMLLCLGFSALLSQKGGEKERQERPLPAFLVRMMLIFLCWLPYFYAYYPGSLSPDSLREIEQQLGLAALSNHHPFLHQLIIGACLKLSGSLESGVALYSLLQMLLLAASFALCLGFLARRGAGRGLRLGALGFFALYPVNGYYSVTMWKDVLHGAATLVLMLLLCAECENSAQRGKKAWLRALGLAAALFVFCALRNNGWYAFLLGFPVFILFNRAGWKRLTAVFAAVLLLMSGYNHLLFDVLGLEKSSSGEALSVPLQQIARTVSQNPQELESPDMQVLSEIFYDFEHLGERYASHISDPVKAADSFKAEAFGEDPARYLKSWAALGIKHPVTYVEAFLLQCYGYWYPDTQYWMIHSNIEPNDLGLEQRPERLGLRFEMDSIARELSETQPTAILFSIGLMVWLTILAAALLMLRGRGKLASPLIIMAMLWLTTLASPVYCEYRYLYGLAVSVPLFAGLALLPQKD